MIVLVALPRPSLAGVQVIVPNSLAAAEGNQNNGFPFNCGDNFGYSDMRYQQVYDGTEVGLLTIDAISFRQDVVWGSSFGPTVLTGVTITLSSTTASPDGLSSTFAANVGADATTVFSGNLTLSSAASGATPRPFNIVIPLATAFTFNPAGGKNLLLDVAVPVCTVTTQFDAQAASGDAVSRVMGNAGDTSGVPSSTGLVTEFSTNDCGDGTIDVGEQCDDGNTVNGDCCDSTCQYEANGSPCPSDGDPCTTNTCDGAGGCGQIPSGCKTAGKSILLLKNNTSDDGKDKLNWKWLKGASTTLGELGTPTALTEYTLCLYAGAASAAVTIPPGAANWQALGTSGFKFKSATGVPEGAQKALLKSGGAGKAKALIKAKGTNLPDTLAPMLTLPVTAQLVNSANSTCFEAVYNSDDVIKNTTTQFKAKQ